LSMLAQLFGKVDFSTCFVSSARRIAEQVAGSRATLLASTLLAVLTRLDQRRAEQAGTPPDARGRRIRDAQPCLGTRAAINSSCCMSMPSTTITMLRRRPVNTRRMPRLLVLAAGATAMLLADGAYAQEPDPNVPVTARPRPEYDPLGIRAGGFLIYPSVSVDGTYNDNIFADDDDEEQDFIIAVQPQISVRSNFPRHSLNWTVESEVGRYVDNTDENYWDYGT